MPMNRKLYPKNWDAIAREVKEAAGWQCEECGRPCRKPGETDSELFERIEAEHPQWNGDLSDEVQTSEGAIVWEPRPTRFTLTVAHLDHTPENCDRANLRAWCCVCHCRYDLKAMATKKRLKAERDGQLNLLVGVDNA